jgi:NNP family nitrate/nitrite transporter-like MFS transporter
LLCALIYYDTSSYAWFLLWGLQGTLGVALRLSAAELGWLVTTPILSAVLLRPVLGFAADRVGARRAALWGLGLTVLALAMGWLWADRFTHLLVMALLLGVAGASFAVALPLASRWYPADRQGLVLGIVGLGQSGMAVAILLAPWLATQVGWRGVFGLALIPVALAFCLVALVARDAPGQEAPVNWRSALGVLGARGLLSFSALYALTFGGFVGLTAFLPVFIQERYGVEPVRAGVFGTFCLLVAIAVRPLGGFLADRLGGVLMLFLFFLGVGFLGMRMSYLPHLEVAALSIMLIMALLGMGSGAVFHLVPQRFADEIGVVTGVVGAAGALWGFLVPLAFQWSYDWTGRFGPGFFVVGMIGFIGAGAVIQASRGWTTARDAAGEAASACLSGIEPDRAPARVEIGLQAVPN